MALSETNIVDIMENAPPGSGVKVDLLMVDHEENDDVEARGQLFVSKLAGYLTYALSDQFAAFYPGVSLKDIRIRVLCRQAPDPAWLRITEVSPGGYDEKVRLQFESLDEYERLSPGR